MVTSPPGYHTKQSSPVPSEFAMPPRLPDTVEHWPLDRLIPYARNARTHDDDQVAQIAASIVEFGWTNPILIDVQGGIVAGTAGCLLHASSVSIDDLYEPFAGSGSTLIAADSVVAPACGRQDDELRIGKLCHDIGSLGVEPRPLPLFIVLPCRTAKLARIAEWECQFALMPAIAG